MIIDSGVFIRMHIMSGFWFVFYNSSIDSWSLDLLLHWRLYDSDILNIILFSNISWNNLIRPTFAISTIKLLSGIVHIGRQDNL